MTLKELVFGCGTQLRSIWMIGMQAFSKRETQMYPEVPVNPPPRFRGRIVLTRDPDGEERCVACNLCAVACPVACISLQKAETADGRWYPVGANDLGGVDLQDVDAIAAFVRNLTQSAMAVVPSHNAKKLTSSPMRHSSITTEAPATPSVPSVMKS